MYTDNSEEDIEYNDRIADAFSFAPELGSVLENINVEVTILVAFANSAAISLHEVERIKNDSLTLFEYNLEDESVIVAYDMDSDRDVYESKLDEALAKGAVGFYSFKALGINDALKKYNKDTVKMLTKEEALAKFDNYTVGDKLFIGASFRKEEPKLAPDPKPYYPSGGGSGGSG